MDFRFQPMVEIKSRNPDLAFAQWVGHYDCARVRAALCRMERGGIDNWLQPLGHVYAANREALDPVLRMRTPQHVGST